MGSKIFDYRGEALKFLPALYLLHLLNNLGSQPLSIIAEFLFKPQGIRRRKIREWIFASPCNLGQQFRRKNARKIVHGFEPAVLLSPSPHGVSVICFKIN